MNTVKAYDEIVDFIAAGTTPTTVITFQPSATAKARVKELLSREKTAALSAEEKSEMDHYMHLEHLMRLAKTKARQYQPS